MVTWGANTVHNIGAASSTSNPATATTTSTTPGGFSFSSSNTGTTTNTTPSLATAGGLFGNTTTSTTAALPPSTGLFGSLSTTPTPSVSTGLFGSLSTSTPAPASTGGLFGSSSFFGGTTTPAPPSGGLFGNTNTTNTSSIFGGGGGSTGSSLFGNTNNPSGSIFGSPAPTLQQQQPPPQIPAQAALQAHMNAYARNEEARVVQRMQTIHQTYTGTLAATDQKSHCFSIPLYNPITEQQRQLQNAISTVVMTTNNQGFMVSSALVAPPKPPQICEEDWKLACIRNPDANHYIPTAVVGAESLLARAILHQEQTSTIQKHMTKIQEAIDHIQQRHGEVTRLLEYSTEQHQKQCTRLLKIMKAVEVVRCFNIPLQSAEVEAFQRIRYLKHSIIEEQLVPEVLQLTESQQQQPPPPPPPDKNETSEVSSISIPMEKQQVWMTILQEHRTQLGKITEVLRKEQQDLQLLHDRVIGGSGNKTTSSKSKMSIALFQQ
jgi:hypothetical protein